MSAAQPLPPVLGSFLDQSPLCVLIIMSDTLDPADSVRVAAVKALLPAIMAKRTGISNVSLIVPRLYLSNYTTATDNAELERLGITHMVSVMDFTPANCPAHIKRLHVVLQDTSTANILQHLEQTTEFITAAMQENETNKVLVHCLMGISRSATVVCAYLIAAHNMTADEALDLVREKRTIACPNLGFRLQLETYESKLRKRTSTTQGPLTRSRTKLWKAESKMVSEGVTSKVFRTFIRSRSIKQSSHQNAEDNSGGSSKPDETPSPC